MDLYSRFVRYLKILLPLAALALLSTLFLLSRNMDLDATIPFSEQEIADRLRGQQVTQPFFTGVTDNDGQITVTASVASPQSDGRPAQATNLRAKVTTLEGVVITMQASTGTLERGTDLATFLGDVVIETSSGYLLETEELQAALSGLTGEAPGTLVGSGPPGRFQAGSMELFTKNDGVDVHTLFKNGVKLLYDPKENIE